MAVLPIAQIGEPVLRAPVKAVDLDQLQQAETQGFIDDLVETMRDACGAGLAANQVFRSWRICAIEVASNPRYPYKPNIDLTVLINPSIEPMTEERFDNYEGCLSVPNIRGIVPRFTEIRVRGFRRDGSVYDEVLRGLSAGTFQHEIDHLDGKLFVDYISEAKRTRIRKRLEKDRRHQTAVPA